MTLESKLRNVALVGLSLLTLACGGDKKGSGTIIGPTGNNNPPAITSSPLREIKESFDYAYTVNASDPDGGNPSVSFPVKPDWLSVSGNTISGTAPEVQSDSTFAVQAKASDGQKTADQNWGIKVGNISNTYVVTLESPERIMAVDENRITFSGSPQFSPGDIIALGTTLETPEGMLRKVESISGDVVYTSQGTLEEAVKNGEVKITGKITPANINKPALRKGVSLYETPLFGIGLSLNDLVLYDDPLGNVVADGSVGLNLSYDLEMKIRHMKIQYLLFTLTAGGKYALDVTASGNLDHLDEKTGLDDLVPLKPFVAGYIGIVPIIVSPKVGLDCGITGNINEIEIGISQELSFTAGLRNESGNWSPIANVTNSFDFQPPVINVRDLDFRAFVGPSIKLLLYGVAGPYGSMPGFVGLKTTPEGWTANAGLEGLVGVQAQIFGRTLADYSARVFETSKVIAEGEFVQEVPGIPDTTGNGGGDSGAGDDSGRGRNQEDLEGWIAFSARKNINSKSDIYITDLNTLERINLTNSPSSQEGDPAWSPDGSKIAYASNISNTKEYKNEIWLMNSDGSEKRRLTSIGHDVNPSSDYNPSWSPDGNRIVFTSTGRPGGRREIDIWGIDINGARLERISKDLEEDMIRSFPGFSPNGQEIIFVGGPNLGSSSIRLMKTNSSRSRGLTESQFSLRAIFPKWSPDGSKIAYSSNKEGRFDIYIMTSDGQNSINLTKEYDSFHGPPTWSPDGSKIAYSSKGSIWKINIDGSNKKELISGSYDDGSYKEDPAWSPR